MESVLIVDGKGTVHCIDVMLVAAHGFRCSAECAATADLIHIIIQRFSALGKVDKVINEGSNHLSMYRIVLIVWENNWCTEEVEQVITMDDTIIPLRDSAHIEVAECVRTSVVEIVQINGMSLCVEAIHMHFYGVVVWMMETAISDKL